jgi:hypothetical protein
MWHDSCGLEGETTARLGRVSVVLHHPNPKHTRDHDSTVECLVSYVAYLVSIRRVRHGRVNHADLHLGIPILWIWGGAVLQKQPSLPSQVPGQRE